ncbi:unnamed protein product [Chrysoparadoxa australica]
MTEYWVSKSRYSCPICKVWMADNKASIRKHEQGTKHIANVEEAKKRKREARFHGASSEADLKKELRDIEAAARATQAQDAALFGGGAGFAAPPPPPAPPKLMSGSDGHVPRRDWGNKGSGQGAGIAGHYGPGRGGGGPAPGMHGRAEEEDKEVEAGDGKYQIDGTWYLDGKKHEELLVTNTPCQLFLESNADDAEQGDGDWIDALVLKVVELSVANTRLKMRRYVVAYFKEGQEKEVVEKDVLSDRLRLIANEKGEYVKPVDEEAQAEVKEDVKDENTGIGQWETVAVRMVDPVKEEKKIRAQAAANTHRAAQLLAKKQRLTDDQAAQAEDDVMGSYDPYGTGKYRGMDVRAPADTGEEVTAEVNEEHTGPVVFKKRKSKGLSKSKRKRHEE